MPSRLAATPESLAPRLLAWYDRHRRDRPWRMAPGVPSDPYRVWVSEVMLQQVRVETEALSSLARKLVRHALAATEPVATGGSGATGRRRA